MKSPKDFFRQYRSRAAERPDLRTLRAVRQEFREFVDKYPQRRKPLTEGELSFCQFSNFVARQYGKSKRSSFGRWTRYTGGFWRILEAKLGNEESGYDTLVMLLDRFHEITCSRKYVAKMALSNAPHFFEWIELEAWECSSQEGCFMNLIYPDRESRIEGFYSSLEELFQSAQTQYKVPSTIWESR